MTFFSNEKSSNMFLQGLKDDFLQRANMDILTILTPKRIKKMYLNKPYNGHTLTDKEIDYLYKQYQSSLMTFIKNYNPLEFISEARCEELLNKSIEIFSTLNENGKTNGSFMKTLKHASDYLKDMCEVCGKNTKNICSKCMKVKYCSKVCQKSHWRVHKLECAKV
jgi:hypothetical protein